LVADRPLGARRKELSIAAPAAMREPPVGVWKNAV
jgi:hypothetical protein